MQCAFALQQKKNIGLKAFILYLFTYFHISILVFNYISQLMIIVNHTLVLLIKGMKGIVLLSMIVLLHVCLEETVCNHTFTLLCFPYLFVFSLILVLFIVKGYVMLSFSLVLSFPTIP